MGEGRSCHFRIRYWQRCRCSRWWAARDGRSAAGRRGADDHSNWRRGGSDRRQHVAALPRCCGAGGKPNECGSRSQRQQGEVRGDLRGFQEQSSFRAIRGAQADQSGAGEGTGHRQQRGHRRDQQAQLRSGDDRKAESADHVLSVLIQLHQRSQRDGVRSADAGGGTRCRQLVVPGVLRREVRSRRPGANCPEQDGRWQGKRRRQVQDRNSCRCAAIARWRPASPRSCRRSTRTRRPPRSSTCRRSTSSARTGPRCSTPPTSGPGRTDGVPDIVIVAMLPEAAAEAIKIYRQGGHAIPILSNNSFRRNYILKQVGAAANGLEGSSVMLADKSRSGEAFLKAFQRRHGAISGNDVVGRLRCGGHPHARGAGGRGRCQAATRRGAGGYPGRAREDQQQRADRRSARRSRISARRSS